MCGIAGILRLTSGGAVSLDDLRPMADAIAHRGPDDSGFRVSPDGRSGMAFRRLSIIDLAGGHQPISNEDGTIWLVFNGEIYNFRELRAELESVGHRFATHSDSETIVHAYEQWGDDFLTRLDGMFALALWDEPRDRLLLARDRVGKKPLVYTQSAGQLLFASEAKAILQRRDVDRSLDPGALHAYFLYQYVPAPHSAIRGLQKLRPGHRVIVECGRVGEQTAYWTPGTLPPYRGTYAEARERLGTLLTAAVRKRLMSDVPLGAFLSGGVDSSIVVALMRRSGAQPLRTFSIGFSDRRYDETAHARRVAELFSTEHCEEIVTPRAADLLDLLVHHYDDPFADSSAIPTYYVSRLARRHVTVALSGDGGDEAFGGYDRYRAMHLSQLWARWPAPIRAIARAAALRLPRGRPKSLARRAFRFLSAADLPPPRRYLAWINILSSEQLAAGYRADYRDAVDRWAEPWLENLLSQAPGGWVERCIRADVSSYLPFDLLTKVDIASMACGLEARCPLLDYTLLDFALSLPPEWKVHRRGGKRILKDWAAELLPRSILERPKSGFGVPVGEWFRAELREPLRQSLLDSDALILRIFDRAWVERLIGEHLSEAANHEHALWSLFMLNRWARHWNPAAAW
jgi:asparagine synthase (glutamine-hydrolysing)